MAVVKLTNVKVSALFSKGFRVIETSKGRGDAVHEKRWTVWTSHEAAVGDVVDIEGQLSAKVNEWAGDDGQVRSSVELSVNHPQITVSERVSAPVRPVEAPVGTGWPDTRVGAAVDAWQDSVPF